MACCAFAVFLLGQLLAALAWLRRLLPRPLGRSGSAGVEIDRVTSWQLFPPAAGLVAAPAVPQRSRGIRRAFLVAAGLELAILGVGALGLAASRSHPDRDRTPGLAAAGVTSFWCRSLLSSSASASER